jgi:hypothetical protein
VDTRFGSDWPISDMDSSRFLQCKLTVSPYSAGRNFLI